MPLLEKHNSAGAPYKGCATTNILLSGDHNHINHKFDLNSPENTIKGREDSNSGISGYKHKWLSSKGKGKKLYSIVLP